MPSPLSKHRSNGIRHTSYTLAAIAILILSSLPAIGALHHMKLIQIRPLNPTETEKRQDNPLIITNNCGDDICHSITTQGGSSPSETGIILPPSSMNNLPTSADWQDHVWSHANCSSNSDGTGAVNNSLDMACDTEDSNGVLNCQVTVRSKTKTTFALLIAVLSLMIVAGWIVLFIFHPWRIHKWRWQDITISRWSMDTTTRF